MARIAEPTEIKSDLPFSQSFIAGLQLIDEGNIQPAFITDRGVLHVAPEGIALTQDQQLICERWVHPKKALVISKVQEAAIAANSTSSVIIPRVHFVGSFHSGQSIFQYWHEEFVSGDSLKTAMFEKVFLPHYQEIIDWASQFHQENESNTALKTYYAQRLEAIIRILSASELSKGSRCVLVEKIAQKGRQLLDGLDNCIDDSEKVSLVHGDLRDGNILIDGSSISIIDFEQGAFGGDWFTDLDKLLKILDNQQPDRAKPYLYRPPLTADEKSSLINRYIASRVAQGWSSSSVLLSDDAIQRRQELIKYDTFVSMLILRDLMGWNFKIEGNKRGTDFILDMIEKQSW